MNNMNYIKIKEEDEMRISNTCLLINGEPVVVDTPNEPFIGIEDGKLLTRFRGQLTNVWSKDQIECYLA